MRAVLALAVVCVNAGCPLTYIYNVPEFWDEPFSLNDLGEQSVTTIFGRKCNADSKSLLGHMGYNTAQYSAPTILLWRLQSSRRCHITTNASEAELFIVPMYLRHKNTTEWARVCESRLNERVVDFLPHLTAENAHRHVFFVGKGHLTPTGRCDAWWRAPRDDRLKRAIRIAYSVNVLPAGVVSNENRTYDAGEWQYGPSMLDEASKADALMPLAANDEVPYPHLVSVPYPSIVHASFSDLATPRLLPWHAGRERTRLMAFVGGMRRDGKYGATRDKLYKDCKKAGKYVCSFATLLELKARVAEKKKKAALTPKVQRSIEHHDEHCDFISSHKAESVFCLEPGGDSPYRKSIYDSMLLGCIPVVFSQYVENVSPWHWGVFRDDSRVLIDERAYAAGELDLVQHLRDIPRQRIAQMQAAIRMHAHRLQYALDDVPHDAVETLLTGAHELAEQRERWFLFPQSSSTSADAGAGTKKQQRTPTLVLPPQRFELLQKRTRHLSAQVTDLAVQHAAVSPQTRSSTPPSSATAAGTSVVAERRANKYAWPWARRGQ